MKKKLFTIVIALILLTLTIYSASAVEIEEIQNHEVHVGVQYSYDVELVSSENVGNLTYTLINGPSDMEISNSGELTWVPTLNDVSNHTITLRVANASDSDDETFSLSVVYSALTVSLNTNSAPNSATLDNEYKFQLQASSNYPQAIDGYNYALLTGPAGMVLINNELIWTPNISQTGTYTIQVSAVPTNAPAQMQPVIESYDVNVQGLVIDRVEIRANSRRVETITRSDYLSSSTPYDVDEDINLGDSIELRIFIENNLPTSTNNELRDVEIELYSYDLTEADGQTVLISRIRAGRTEDQTISFNMDPSDLHPDDSPFDLEIRVFGETRDGDSYSDSWTLELRVEAKSYDLLLANPVLTPATVCAGDRLRVSYNLRNVGTRDLSSAGVRYYLPELDIDEWERNINIDYDESRTISRFLDIPQNTNPGEYYLELIAHPRLTSSSDTTTDMFSFSVRDCETVDDDEDEEEEEPIIITPPVEEVVVPGTPVSVAEGSKQSIFNTNNPLYTVLLTVIVVLLLIGVILLLITVFK